MDDHLERNKQTVTAFCDLIFNQSMPAEAIDRYAGERRETVVGAVGCELNAELRSVQ